MSEEAYAAISDKISDLRMQSSLIGGALEYALDTIADILEQLAREAVSHDH